MTPSAPCPPLLLLLTALILCPAGAAAAASDPGILPAPEAALLRPVLPGGRITRVAAPPDLSTAEPFSDSVWNAAEPLGPLCDRGRIEPAGQESELRLLLCDSRLYLRGLFRSPEAPRPTADLWSGDALELFLRERADAPYPYIQWIFAADGRVAAARHVWRKRGGADPGSQEPLPAEAVVCKAGATPGGKGWWLCAAVPLATFGLTPSAQGGELHGNLVRDLAGGKRSYSWIDLPDGSSHRPDIFAALPLREAPLPPQPAFTLPQPLAVGVNRLPIRNFTPGCRLRVDETAVEPDAGGNATVVLTQPGRVRLTLSDAEGRPVQIATAKVLRPLLINTATPFVETSARTVPVTVQLTVALPTEARATLTVEAHQKGRLLGAAKAALASGRETLAVPVEGATPGEIRIVARASVPLAAGGNISLEAVHWCMIGTSPETLNRFRPDLLDPARLAATDLPALYRLAVADAGAWYRLLQAGDGRFRALDDSGKLTFDPHCYGACHVLALLYTADWPENPCKGDRRFLESAALGLDAALDPAANRHSSIHFRHLRAYALTYELLKDLVPPSRSAGWQEGLREISEGIIAHLLEPMTQRYAFYGQDVGTGTNHFGYAATGVWQVGRVLGEPAWQALAASLMSRLAEHGRDGHFPERRGISATHYTWLTINALGEYHQDTGDATVLPVLARCTEYALATSLPAALLLLHDGRNNEDMLYFWGDFVLTGTPEGRALARRRALRLIGPGHRPGDTTAEIWGRMAQNALYARSGPGGESDAPDAPPGEFSFLDGTALIARQGGFIYGLSAVGIPPVDYRFVLDPQNAVELHHVRAGVILGGANSQAQPEAGSFFRKITPTAANPGGTVFLPQPGISVIQRTGSGHAVVLDFGSFTTKLTVSILDADRAAVKVDLLTAAGPEPVVFNFFPGGAQGEGLAQSEDGRRLTFGAVVIDCSTPVTLQRDFLIFNAYTEKRTIRSKPVRASVELACGRPLELSIHLTRTTP